MGTVSIDAGDRRYCTPLARSIKSLLPSCDNDCDVVLLGSVATGKYADVLTKALDRRIMFPSDFVGRGDMSRGGLMLRCVDEGRELENVPIDGSIRRGQRPPKLQPRAAAGS
jgi:hypothetical protein